MIRPSRRTVLSLALTAVLGGAISHAQQTSTPDVGRPRVIHQSVVDREPGQPRPATGAGWSRRTGRPRTAADTRRLAAADQSGHASECGV